MIEIFINPDNNDLFQEQAEAKGDNSEGISNAEVLLRELHQLVESDALTRDKTDDRYKCTVLEAYILMASKQKPKIEKALNELMKTVVQDPNYVPGVLGIANALVLLGQPPKARNQLKRIAKMKVCFDVHHATSCNSGYLNVNDIILLCTTKYMLHRFRTIYSIVLPSFELNCIVLCRQLANQTYFQSNDRMTGEPRTLQ
jgi:hypothetical protein